MSYLDGSRAELRSAVMQFPPSLRSVSPDSNRWSFDQILEHLVLVEAPLERFFSSKWIRNVRAGALASEHDTTPITPGFDVERAADRRQPRISPALFEPLGTLGAGVAWRELETIRARLRRTLLSADGLAWGDAMLTYPGLGRLRMNVYHWVLWLGSHEIRHTHQILEMRDSLLERPAKLNRVEGHL